MSRLLQIELKKILNYKTFWIIFGLYFVFLIGGILFSELIINGIVNDINKKSPLPLAHISFYTFPDVWQNISFFASIRFVMVFPAVLMIILITNEFIYKTINQNILNGLSRYDFVLSKLIIVGLLCLLIWFIVFLSSLILGITHTDNITTSMFFSKIEFSLAFLSQLVAFLVFAMFIALLLRNTGLSLAVFMLYVVIIEPLVVMILKIPPLQPNTVGRYFPVNAVLNIVEYPAIPSMIKLFGFKLQENVVFIDFLAPAVFTMVFIGIMFLILKKRDL